MAIFEDIAVKSGSNMFFTADTHFGSSRHLEYNFRPFHDVDEMDTVIMNNWNNRVGADDTIFVLGDFGDYSMLPKLNGNKWLLVGNYERDDYKLYCDQNPEDTMSMEKFFLAKGFSKVFVDDSVLSPCGNYELVHEPSHRSMKDKCYLFGHIHGTQRVKPQGLNVGVDCHHFCVLSTKDIEKHMEAINKWMDDEVFKYW